MRLGITVLDDVAAASRWPDENTAAIVSFGEHIALKPGLDDGLRTDVLAMALIVAAVMGDRPTAHQPKQSSRPPQSTYRGPEREISVSPSSESA